VFSFFVIALYGVTVLSSALNTCYFLGYHSVEKRRRVGATALALLSLAIVIESLYYGLFTFFLERGGAIDFFLDPGHWLVAGTLFCLGSVFISVLILRQLKARRQ